jgi:glycosyltransferase involved in cell wall biosynthesis
MTQTLSQSHGGVCMQTTPRDAKLSHQSGYDRLGLMIITHTTEYLAECLDSVANQTVAPSAVVLVDNASGTQGVRELAGRYGIPTICLDSPVTLATARNIACSALADCDLIVNLDGDDVITPRFLEVYWSTARQCKADVVFGATEFIGSRTGVAFTRAQLGPTPDLRRGNYVSANSLFKRSLWREVGGFDPSCAYFEDWDFWLCLAERGAIFQHIDEPLWYYRRHEHSMLAASTAEERFRSKQLIRQKHRRYIGGLLQWRRVASKVARARRKIGRKPNSAPEPTADVT